MPRFAVYKASDGEITQLINTPSDTVVVQDSEAYMEVDDTISDATYRINLTTLEPELKTALPTPATLNTSVDTAVVITGLPQANVACAQQGESQLDVDTIEITDGTLNFTTDLAGEYTLFFTSPLYLATTTVITVTD